MNIMFPTYRYHSGTKRDVFNGIKIYLSECKDVYNEKVKLADKLYSEIQELNKTMDDSFHNDIEIIIAIEKALERKKQEWLMLKTELCGNEVKLHTDLVSLFID